MWEVVGILESEERVYEALVPRQSTTAADMAAKTGLTRARASQILGRLVDLGLATRLPGKPAQFFAVLPDLAATTLIAAQESKLGQLRRHAQRLTDTYQVLADERQPAGLVDVIKGPGNVRSTFVRLQREARRQVRVFDKPPYSGEQPESLAEEYRILGEGHVAYRTLYDKAVFAEPGRIGEIRRGIRRGERARIGSPPMKMALSDDRLALIPILIEGDSANQAAYLIHSSSLLRALSELFEMIWATAIPFNQKIEVAEGPRTLTDQDRDLLGLLAAGSTDEMIARTLGCSARTVQRHVHRVMKLVHAQTRFQAGLEASRRGWV